MTQTVKHTQCANRISTHTLTWSVTFFAMIENRIRFISTHTLTWSVTYFRIANNRKPLNFNSHAHVERDGVAGKETEYLVGNFNSHAHVERDPMAYLKKSLSINFNSHAHVERDFKSSRIAEFSDNFNSHAHVERDQAIDNN